MFGAPWLLLWAISNHDEWARVKYGKETMAVWERPSIRSRCRKLLEIEVPHVTGLLKPAREVPVMTLLEAIVADWLKEGGYLK